MECRSCNKDCSYTDDKGVYRCAWCGNEYDDDQYEDEDDNSSCKEE